MANRRPSSADCIARSSVPTVWALATEAIVRRKPLRSSAGSGRGNVSAIFVSLAGEGATASLLELSGPRQATAAKAANAATIPGNLCMDGIAPSLAERFALAHPLAKLVQMPA